MIDPADESLEQEAYQVPEETASKIRQIIQEEIKEFARSQFTLSAKAAFQTASAQLLALGFLALIFYNFQMISDFFTPFFWALFFSVVLRRVKAALFVYFDTFAEIEKDETINKNKFYVEWEKFKYLWKHVLGKSIFMFVVFSIASKCSCHIFQTGCWVPWIYLIIFVLILSFIVSLIFTFSSSSSIDNVLSIVIVVAFFIVTATFMSLFVFKAITETGEFISNIQPIVQQFINDPQWATTIEKFGIQNDTIPNLVDQSTNYAVNWLESEGYNITEIEESIQRFAIVNSNDNSTGISIDFEKIEQSLEVLSQMNVFEVYEKITSFADWTSLLVSMSGQLIGFAQTATTYLLELIDQSLNSFIFVGALMFLVSWDTDVFDTLFKLVPASASKQMEISATVQRNISQLFLVSLLLCIYRGAVTWIYFSVMNIGFTYSAAFMTAPTAIFPLISPWLLFVPAILATYLRNDPFWVYYLVGIIISEFFVIDKIQEEIHGLMPDSSPYLTGLGLALGVSTFGLEGILIGPLLIILLKTCYSVFREQIAEQHAENNDQEPQ